MNLLINLSQIIYLMNIGLYYHTKKDKGLVFGDIYTLRT